MTASILAAVGSAYSSAKGLYELIDGIRNTPADIKQIKTYTSAVQKVLNSLKATLKERPDAIIAISERVEIKDTVGVCDAITKDFIQTIEKYTKHSKDSSLRKRNRLTATFRKSKLEGFQTRLNAAKYTIQFAVTAAML